MSVEIELYVRTLKDLEVSIEELQSNSGYNNTNHKITLLFSLLDLMSKCVSDKTKNRERFIDFVNEFCSWNNGKRVSLPQLLFYLSEDHSSRLTELREYVSKILDTWPTDEPISIEYDPEITQIEALWPSDYRGLNRTTLNHFTHTSLLWNQRNSLVHEMRGRGYGWGLFEESSPYYTSCSHVERNLVTQKLEINNKTFELYYPFSFYTNLVNEAINNICIYLEQNDINPYNAYRFGSLWLDIDN
ncbi:hypothetical protein [Clostridium sp. JNZ J1-5]